MKLIQEIIDLLSSENGKLTEALIKTKILLHKLGHKELTEWVNHELNGYTDKDSVPSYRVLPAQVLVNASNMAYQVNSHPIPLGHLPDKQRQQLENSKMDQSLAVLEKLTEGNSNRLQAPIPMEANGILGEGLANGYQIQSAWCEVQTSSVIQILTQVRSRLLDFILEIDGQISGELDEKDIENRASEIDTSNIFNNAIFGDNTTILLGAGNTQNVNITQVEGNIEELKKILSENMISNEDIILLESALKEDEKPTSADKFGPKVSSWFATMMKKSADGSWGIGVGAAGSLLAQVIAKFYGLS